MTILIDPYRVPAFSFMSRLKRQAWNVVWFLFGMHSPRFAHSWRLFLLRLFGAKIGSGCAIYPRTRIWAPWNLVCEDVVAIAEGVEIYNPSPVFLGSHAILSQGAYLCGATHDMDDVRFPLISGQIYIGPYAWVCARAIVMLNVRVEAGAVVGLASVATKSLEPWGVYAGSPARLIRKRKTRDFNES